jgi:hypothetical protein
MPGLFHVQVATTHLELLLKEQEVQNALGGRVAEPRMMVAGNDR